ncbi:amino-acid N-acetyltransferase [Alteromonas sp. ASW11-130]|uniref:amino-acid N-acetyltransferase n=1 Tax=Alteromonas sp. ASW11-130 TaxID=3015775 RepID=UPI002241ECA6|nr:amino-acid N-acetyltransferase [Alteromonas sp. ASW11-130]MCW8090908.1 amino-acid N-acetyltransferase [Alteromonas sp. ASW11-130]
MVLSHQDGVALFRSSAPYINAHRGKTFVLMLGGEALQHENFPHIIHDIALLNSLGVRLVLVHGARPQVDERIALRNIPPRFSHDKRITDNGTLECVKDAAGSARAHIEALLTTGLPNSPMHGAQIRVCSGNLVVAKPAGVRDGVDLDHTGEVRRIDVEGISDHLNDGSIVLLSPMGYSTTGEVFNLSHEDVATNAAIALKADKLIAFSSHQGIFNQSGKLLRTIERQQLEKLITDNEVEAEKTVLHALISSVTAGIPRAHCISYEVDGALLQELFTRDGCGSLVLENHYEQLRKATIDDVGGILALIKPLEESGALVTRSRERLEQEIEHFFVIVRDGMIIACAALYLFHEEKNGELACVATHQEYRGKHRGERLLDAIKQSAKEQDIEHLFVLTTLTSHWFLEQGFVEAKIESLPTSKKELYNFQRNSKVFQLPL